MDEGVQSLLIGTLPLDALLLLALLLTLTRGRLEIGPAGPGAIARIAAVALLLQAAHFTEELATGFPRRFPELLGLAAWPTPLFVGGNVFWLGAWALAILRLEEPGYPTTFALWFLGIGGVANVVAHPLLSLLTGGYFPGLLTAPLVGVAGLALLRRLHRGTVHRPVSP